ncbi:hypothetical protein [Serratia sp. PL7]|uniref:hypothetical protein n=1 Tax=Serratia sp. PL7 TaxID=2952201 RepID=UPI0019DEDC80|nr:hypothetical protein [Serratia sp. PL7]MBE0153491.1 hypothetical protein [Serratia fonticola]
MTTSFFSQVNLRYKIFTRITIIIKSSLLLFLFVLTPYAVSFSKSDAFINISDSLLSSTSNIGVENKTFNITPQIFVNRVNKNLKKMGGSFLVSLKLEGNGKYFEIRFSKYNRLIGGVDKKTGMLNKVTIITSGDEISDSNRNLLEILTSLFSALLGDDALDTPIPITIIMKLTSNGSEIIVNGVVFSLIKTDNMGDLFIAKPL